MGKNGSTFEKIKRETEEVLDDAATSPWTERLARFGYATKGVVYLVIGALSMLVALGLGGKTTDTRGALAEIEKKPFGKVALVAVAFGLIAYVIWRWVQAVADTEGKGRKLKGILIRIGYFCSGAVYAGLAFTAAKVLFDVDEPDSSSNTQQQWIARLLSVPLGYWLALIVGGSVIGFGLFQIYKGLSAKFRKRLKLGAMSKKRESWATWSGRIGYAARGVVFCIIGFFIIQATLNFKPSETKGLDEVLEILAENYYGAVLLGVVAFGLIAYGFYMLIEARYHRIEGVRNAH